MACTCEAWNHAYEYGLDNGGSQINVVHSESCDHYWE